MDEATTAVDEDLEAELYELILSFASLVVSVGYRSTLARFHTKILELNGDGTWKLGGGGR
jgi:putative ATP-binding cassette transporter